ncbi:hypothetical protein [Streptomyces sp. NPDC002491]
MRYENRARLIAVRALVAAAVLVSSPVLLLAGAPIRRRYVRHVLRDAAPQILDKERGRVGVHYFVITSRLLAWCCLPTEALGRSLARRGGTPGG